MRKKTIKLDIIDSTNIYLREQAKYIKEDMVIARAEYQLEGRGQGGNGWESKAGENLLFSILIHPTMIPVKSQFLLSMVGGVAVKSVLDGYVENITLKWPNDIYWKDKKLSGTLIETAIDSHGVKDCIYGVGLNVNQVGFESNAPNPVSLREILGYEIDREKLLQEIVDSFEIYYEMLQKGQFEDVVSQYHSALYRKEGIFPYKDCEGYFQASIVRVEADGRLILKDSDGVMRAYYLKQVEFVQE